jgi:3-mercaptopyruvate sulfurtransferase SseA
MLQSLVTTNWLNDTLDHPDLVILYTTLIPKKESISVEVENLQIKGAQFFIYKLFLVISIQVYRTLFLQKSNLNWVARNWELATVVKL